jgi:hypothetical protein
MNSFACECSELNKSNVEEFKEGLDYILIGTVIDQLNPDKSEYFDYSWKKEKEAYDIIVKVRKVFKGNIQTDTIYITQFFNGACSRKFSAGKDYIFAGKEIKKFVNQYKKNKSNIESDSVPIINISSNPNEYKFEKGVIYDNFPSGTEKWNSLLEKHKMISTNRCYSFNIENNIGQLLIE